MPTLREDVDALWRYKAIPAELPESVTGNLNPFLPLRPYQREALARLFWYLNKGEVHPIHLLFHMATGSGKTLIMAASIFHLYEQGYRNFIFFVNRDNIINKTRENFLNPHSSKYQFAERLKFGAKEIQIREVENFESIHPDDINILFTTIQGLHSRLNTPRENSLTYEDFADKNIVLISDEAHHINALTKSQKDLKQDELFALDTWEATVRRIFNVRPDNILVEFTATVELDNEAIANKYQDKILYEYPLKKYREDGYSKEVNVLQIDLPPMERALQAIILSQYRRKVAEKYGLFLKPVILMKSRLIVDSRKFEAEFKAIIAKLTANDLERLRREANALVLKQAFVYFEKQNITLENLALELREDFGENRCLSVNSKEESEEKQLLVNSLEDHTNEIRVIFAVDKLNEGWDVLNLFDIIRLYNTRDAKHNIPGKTTISEAQLIGRGARYFPFKLNESQVADQRKFDSDLDNELRVLEELYYHSQHNPDYISELHKALVQTGIVPPRTRTVHMRVKDSFKQTDFWKNGVVFVNKRVVNPREDIFGLKNIEFTKRHTYHLSTGFAQESALLGGDVPVQGEETKTQTYSLIDFGYAIIRKATSKLDFYQFSNLKHYFPHLKSITEFISSDDYLKPVSVEVSGNPEQIKALTADEKLNIAVKVLEKIAHEIPSATPEVVGTKIFEPLALRICVKKDKLLEISYNDGGEQERGLGMRETTNLVLNMDLRDKAWYVYDENYGTSEEKYFIKFVHSAVDRLQQKYTEIYLLRNEQLFTIYRFSDGRAMQPDFVLFAMEKNSGKSIIYQLFVEPKGGNLLVDDKWKEDFLKEIENECKTQVLFENKEFRLIGMPFYNEIITKTQFENRFNEVLLG